MMKFKIRAAGSRRKFPEVVFEDEKFAPVGEMLLAERAFLPQITEALDSVLTNADGDACSFAGNAFSLYITEDYTRITNDITGTEAEAPTAELKKLVRMYKKHYDKIHR